MRQCLQTIFFCVMKTWNKATSNLEESFEKVEELWKTHPLEHIASIISRFAALDCTTCVLNKGVFFPKHSSVWLMAPPVRSRPHTCTAVSVVQSSDDLFKVCFIANKWGETRWSWSSVAHGPVSHVRKHNSVLGSAVMVKVFGFQLKGTGFNSPCSQLTRRHRWAR